MSVKAQVFSFDFIIACSIFILILFVLYGYWAYSYIEIEETRSINEIIDKAQLSSNVWFREGTPKYWNSSNIVELGLENDHVFNQTKMDNLNADLGYDKTRSLLDISGYEYYFRIYNSTNDDLFIFGLYPSNSENVVKINRVGVLNDTVVIVEVLVWK